MKAAFIHSTGPADSIIVDELQTPEVKPGHVRIRVEAVAVNPVDTYIRSGAIQMPLPKPFIVGCDLAGAVESVGSGVKGVREGDRVWATNQGLLGRQGTFAEYAVIDPQWMFPLPDGVEAKTAAACALTGVTAHLGLFREARLRANDVVLIVGGTGGVGSMVLQMAKSAGAIVIATGGTEAKVQRCRDLGADLAVNYKTEDIAAAVREFAPEGVNVFWETRRVPDFDLAVDLMAERGRMVLMAGRDARPEFPVGPFYVKGCAVHGFVMFKATSDEMRMAADDMNVWLADGRLVPEIGKLMTLEETPEAHRIQEQATIEGTAELSGKIVIEI
jgi:NADPH2:quinone reductase